MTVTRPTPAIGNFYMNDSYIVTITGTAPTATIKYWAKYQIIARLGDGTVFESEVYLAKGGIPVKLDLVKWTAQFLRASIPVNAAGTLNENTGWLSIGLKTGENSLDIETCGNTIGEMTDQWTAVSEEVVVFEGKRQIDNVLDVNDPQLTFRADCIHMPRNGHAVVSGWNMGGSASVLNFLDKNGDLISDSMFSHPWKKWSFMINLEVGLAPPGTEAMRIDWGHGLGSTAIKITDCGDGDVNELVFYSSYGGWNSIAFDETEINISKVSDLIELELPTKRAYNRRAVNKASERQISWRSIGQYTKDDKAYLESFASSFRYLLRVNEGADAFWVPVEFHNGAMQIYESGNTIDLVVTANLILEV